MQRWVGRNLVYQKRECLGYSWIRPKDSRVQDLADILDKQKPQQLKFSQRIEKGIPIYGREDVRKWVEDQEKKRELQDEWNQVLVEGAGVMVMEGVYEEEECLDRATQVFRDIVQQQESQKEKQQGDHFGGAHQSDRIWNSLQKLCIQDPSTFMAYFDKQELHAVCEAYLGPGYQMTSQVNVVRPGADPQRVHRDYHLGFMTEEQAYRYPIHQHLSSQCLTLQGAVAHQDMPLPTGPTLFLPGSQLYPLGYVATYHPSFQAYFDTHHVQVPLRKGDVVWFNPALMHAAGANKTSDVHRLANLLQVSSAFGRPMEAVDRSAMVQALFPLLQESHAQNGLSASLRNVIASSAEGYSFPNNLDANPPQGALAPPSQASLVYTALLQNWSQSHFESELVRLQLSLYS